MRLIGIVFAIAMAACSARVEYEQPRVAAVPGSVNINTANVAELERLPGIGRKTAESIVEFREQNGPFRRVEHLMQIRGISEARFLELRPYISVNNN